MENLGLWVAFNLFVLLLLALDLGVLHRHAKAVSVKEAAWWSVVWVIVALVFNAGMYAWYGPAGERGALALQFFTGYLIERMLSIDNIFVFLVLFNYFAVEPRYQYRVLFWGILGALIMRGAMIAAGAALIARFHWLLYVFGAFLVWTGAKLMFHKAEEIHPEHNPVLRLARKFLPVTKSYHGQDFFVRENGILHATPMFLVLLVVETTDLAFALDSIPAIFAITTDPFIIYSSNVFAILGLRALYFLLAGIMPFFRYLNHGLSLVLMFIGAKMLAENWLPISTGVSLAVVAGVLAVSVLASVIALRREQRAGESAEEEDPAVLVPLLASADQSERESAAASLYRRGSELADTVAGQWREDPDLAALFTSPPVVGVAVKPELFERIHRACGAPRLASVPPDQEAREFELHFSVGSVDACLDILTTVNATGQGALARFLEKLGEGIQQVEYCVADVDRATALLREKFNLPAVYPATRPGADSTRVNFFLCAAPDGRKVLIELFEK